MKYDVVIVGAGPAGLAAALELSSTSLSILVVDKGKPIDGRVCSSVDDFCVDHPSCSVTHGSGGAGLYSDGKLCLDPSVGGDISRFYPDAGDLMERVVDMLSLDGHRPVSKPVNPGVASWKQAFGDAGLDFKYYDVVRLGLAERLRKVKRLEGHLREKGVEFLFDADARHISANRNYCLSTSKGDFHCSYLVVAPGKVGANWFQKECDGLGVASRNNPLYVGVRLELPRGVTSELAAVTDNPRISLRFPNGDFVKTHCFSDKGRVVIADYGGLKLVEGNYFEDKESSNAAVNIVMELKLPEYVVPFDFSSRFVQQVNSFGNGRPVVQTVQDLFNFSATSKDSLKSLSFLPTLYDCKGGDLSHLYSVRFADRLSEFLKRVDRVLPGFADGGNLVYAPFVEWWMRKVSVNRFFEARPNLYAVGDGAGMSQGIIAAGMQGVACANGIKEKIIS